MIPFIPMFREDNTRTGSLADADQAKLARECGVKGLWLHTAFAIGCTFGWRLSEVLGLRVRQVDLADRTVRLEVGSTKNGRGRLVSLTEECFTLLQACCVRKKPDDHVLTRDKGKTARLPRCMARRSRASGTREVRLPKVRTRTGDEGTMQVWKPPSMEIRRIAVSRSAANRSAQPAKAWE